MVEIASPLVAAQGLGVQVRYPGVNPAINPDPTMFQSDGDHSLNIVASDTGDVHIRRTLDDTNYYSGITASGKIEQSGPYAFRVAAAGRDRLTVMVRFDQQEPVEKTPAYSASVQATTAHWNSFWTQGGAVDFTGSTDPRAAELERRVVLSQYLSAVNGGGELPPQEEGLFSNSWYGKFHLEMHPWHAGWQAMWGHPDMLERSLPWYVGNLDNARAEAARHQVKGAWWPKMVGPEGRNSPSLVSPFIMWQQPHPILLAELVWRADKDPAVLDRYGEVVEATADLLATWPIESDGRLNLGTPMIPAQENYDPLTTVNPTFEVEYFRWALETAQQWRERKGQARRIDWDQALAKIAPPPMRDGLYLPVESVPDFWETAMSDACRRHAAAAQCKNRDHPSFLMAYGFIPGARIDPATMRRTFEAVEQNWDVRQTWGLGFPNDGDDGGSPWRTGQGGELAVHRPEEQSVGRNRDDPARSPGRTRRRTGARLGRRRRRDDGGQSGWSRLSPRGRDLFPVQRVAADGRRSDGSRLGRVQRPCARFPKGRLDRPRRRPDPRTVIRKNPRGPPQ